MKADIEFGRVSIAKSTNLEKDIENWVNQGHKKGFTLISTFTYKNELVLIFQKVA